MHKYSETTQDILITVTPTYSHEHSHPAQSQYVFVYKVSILNQGSKPVQLLARHWIITDGSGHVEEVQGPGVIGVQPKIKPGQSHEYESFCPLATPVGNMRGTYLMTDETGHQFKVKIPLFFLRSDLGLQ
jgi:ApaG protein